MLTLKHLRTLPHVSILTDHHHGSSSVPCQSLNFKKKSLSLKFLKVNRGDVAA